MYRITYDGLTIFDPYGDANEVVSDASMSVEVNASAYLDFTMAMTHPLHDTIRERTGVVTLTWDSMVLFEGIIESIEMDIQGNKSISCVSAMDYLNDTHVRPYSTVAGEADFTAPSSVDGYFQWLIDQHNDHVLDTSKMFDVGINQGANLQQNNFIYRSSESEPTTASEIADQILDSLGGYLTMRYEDGRKVLDLYADLHTMNAQIVDFGVNITDFTKTIDTTDQYTAILLHGGSPTFEGGDLEGGDWSQWETHPNTPLVGDKTHGGSVASYFVSGTGEYINDSFFYSRPGRRYKATVYVKNERGSNVTIRGSYQYEQAGGWTTVNVNSSLTVENKDDQWTEFSFDFQPNLSEYTKIRPRWYFDNIGNDGNRRVYLDDFSFSQIDGDTEVPEDPIGLKQVPNGVSSFDADVFKSGDVLYSTSAVERYGYKEEVFEDTTITNIDDLVQAGIKELNKSKDPQITLDIKAVDLALFMEGYTHLNVGDVVRVRSAIHDTDEFLMVNSITLDPQDPGQSEYVIGKAYDSLTGQQSGFLRSLNSGINSSLDAVASLDQTTKDQAIKIGSVENVANQAKDTANNAQNTANAAQNTANANKTELQNVKQSVSNVQSDVDAVAQKAKDLASDLDGTKATVEQVTTDLGEVKTTVSNAATKADQALRVSTSASQSATEAKTTATSAYQDAQSALTQSSTASQTANAVKTELETNYSTTDEIAKQYATKSLVEQTSQSITSTVEATYATKAAVEGLENIANNAVQTWMGSGVPTLSNKPASDWTTAELKSQHSGDIYYDSDTGYSYRFGSSDGKNYSWSLIKDTDITKAVADAAKAQQTAEGVSDEVTQLKTDIPATYATKTEVKQTSDSLTVTISSAMSKAESAATAATNAQSTANTANSTANTAKNNAATAQSTANTANSNAQNAQNRVGNLETCIKMTSDGVRVGKISNGNFTGYSALVNSSGSFDILGSDSSVISRFSSKGLQIGSGGDKYHFFVGTGRSSEEAFIGIINDENNDFNAPPDPEAGYSGLFFDRTPQQYATSLVDVNGPIAIAGQGITISSNSPSSSLFLQEAGGGITTYSDTKIYCQDRASGTKVNVGANMRVQMKNLSAQAPHFEMTIDRILSNDLGYKLITNGDVTSIGIEFDGIYQVFGNVNVYCPNDHTKIGIEILRPPYTAWTSTRDDLMIEANNTWYSRFFMASCPLAKGDRITWRGNSFVSSGRYTTLCLMYMGPAYR